MLKKPLAHSGETISRQFHSVLLVVLKIGNKFIKQDYTSSEGSDSSKWKWFKGVVGPLDGTHVPLTVPSGDKGRYRNQKGYLSTNVFAACDSYLRLTYVLPGWEGSASDSRVLRDALQRPNGLKLPKNKYFLIDVGYTNGLDFLAPYRGTRFYLQFWKGNTPTNSKELFNHRHSSANDIERAFGLLKKRWAILRRTIEMQMFLKGHLFDPMEVVEKYKSMLRNQDKSRNDPEREEKKEKAYKEIKWKPPDQSEVKLNVDAGWINSEEEAYGGWIMRDSQGTFQGGAWKNYKCISAEVDEAIALRNTVEDVQNMGLRKVLLESDCKSLVETIIGSKNGNWEIRNCVSEIKQFLDSTESSLLWIRREANRAADLFVSLAAKRSLQENFVFESPEEMKAILSAEEATGIG